VNVMINCSRTFILLSTALALTGCWAGTYEYPAAQYVNRSQTITPSAGNAQEVNEASQVIDPWPRNVSNRDIPANGDRMVNSVEKYRARGAPIGPPGGTPNGGIPSFSPSAAPAPIGNPSTPAN
jgi:hypothetical protein